MKNLSERKAGCELGDDLGLKKTATWQKLPVLLQILCAQLGNEL